MDRQHQPVAEAVVGILALDLDPHAGFAQHGFIELSKRALERLPVARGIAEAEFADRGVRKPAAGQIGTWLRPVGTAQIAFEPGLRRGGHIVQAGALFRALGGARIGGGNFHARFGRQFLHRVHEREAALVGQPADRIAMRFAAEAVVEALLVIDVEARCLFVVERAAGLEFAPGLGQPQGATDHRGQRGPHAQFV